MCRYISIFIIVFFLITESGIVCAKDVLLNRLSSWIPMGSGPVTVEEVKEEEENDKVLCFKGTFDKKTANSLWPLVLLPKGLPGVTSISFEMKLLPTDVETLSGSVHFANQEKVSGSFSYALPTAGKWERINVSLKRPGFSLEKVRTIQIIVQTKSPRITCYVRNISLHDENGTERQSPVPPKPAPVIRIRPAGGSGAFFVEPGRMQSIIFETEGLKEGTSIQYNISNYGGQQIGSSRAATVRQGNIILKEAFSAGYYEINFPEHKLLFGLFSRPVFTKKTDPFYAIEGLIGPHSEKNQRDICNILLKAGIASNREWCNYSQYEPKPGEFKAAEDKFYPLSGQMGLRSIFCFARFPDWCDNISLTERKAVPRRLVGLDQSIRSMIQRRKEGLEAFHIMNEYDLLPCSAEVSLPIIKMAAYAMRDSDLMFIGAPFCQGTASESSVRCSLANGLLEHIDAFAFHNYLSPESIVPMIRTYRDMLAGTQKQWLPFWITECGKPWHRGLPANQLKAVYGGPRGNLHPKGDEDMISALWITMKGVEAKAGGVAKYFPFTLHFFEENNNNFGMMDFHRTPLRPLAAYMSSVRELAGKSYIGDWNKAIQNVTIARMFADEKELTCVLYTGSKSEKTVSLKGIPFKAIRSIDGSDLALNQDETVNVYGGLVYVVCDRSQIKDEMINKETEAMSLLQSTRSYQPVKRIYQPVIFQFCHWTVAEKDTKRYYMTKPEFRVNVYNCEEKEVIISPRLVLPEGMKITGSPSSDLLKLRPQSVTELVWTLDIKECKESLFDIKLDEPGYPGSQISIPFLQTRNLRTETFDFMNPKRWKGNSSGKSEFTFDKEENALRISTLFAPENRNLWVFPEYHLQLPDESLEKAVALSFDLKFRQKDGAIRISSPLVMFSNPKTMKGYHSIQYGEPTEQWRHFMVALDPAIKKNCSLLRIGMCPTTHEIDYWIKNVTLYFSR